MGVIVPGSTMQLSVSQMAAICLLVWVTWSVWSYLTSPLRQYPGPWLAGWTNLWRLYQVATLSSHTVVEELHQKHGPVVRIGPNLLSLKDPSLIKRIFKYEIDKDSVKTEFYHGGCKRDWTGKVILNTFGMSDRKQYAATKKPIGNLYSMSNSLALEKHVNASMTELCDELESRFVKTDKTCPLDEWLMYFAWDVVGVITFSKSFGYMKQGRDFDGTLADAKMAFQYLGVVGQIPILDFFIAQNPILNLIHRAPFTTAFTMARERVAARLSGKDADTHDAANPDHLDAFIQAREKYPDIVTKDQLQFYILINLTAGADTTAGTMTAVLYLSLKHPVVWKRLEAEVLDCDLPDDEPISYKAVQSLPYLDAVVRESMRLQPSVGMPLERYVSDGGLELPDGSFVPAGAAVGMNPYVVNRGPVFGEDPESFRPERWLQGLDETDEAFRTRLAAMNAADLTFGAGSRMCCGMHIARVEVYKVIPTLIKRFRIELHDKEKQWKVENGWFVHQSGVDVKLQRR